MTKNASTRQQALENRPLSLRSVARTILPRGARNWLRSPVKSSRYLYDELCYCCGWSREIEIRPGWRLRCHPMAFRCAYSAQQTDPEQIAEFDSFLRHCTPGMALFDIGAHFGLFAQAALYFGGPEARAVAVDPSPWATRMMRIQAKLNQLEPRWQVLEAAIGERIGEHGLVATGVFADGYLVPPSAGHSSSELTTIPMLTLDELVRQSGVRPTHVKIDVESYELEALQGGTDLFGSPGSPLLFIELHNDMARARGVSPELTLGLLAKFGYRLHNLAGVEITQQEILAAPLIRVVGKRITNA